MSGCDVLVVGGGAAGLACRAALAGARETLLLERESETGGLLRVRDVDGFHFEPTLHVMFFRDPAFRAAVESLLPAGVRAFVKENAVWQRGRRISYPYQYHARELPDAVRDECLQGFRRASGAAEADASYEAWLRAHYGDGFYRHFFRPYNQKLYGVPPAELEAAPMLWTLPPDERDAVLGEGVEAERVAHPSTHALYPRGPRGIAALSDALRGLSADPVRCGTEVVEIDAARKVARTASGERIAWRALASSLPLPVLVERMAGVPAEVAAAAAQLRAAAVTTVQVGVREDGGALPEHWTYFPDPGVPFYRLARLERISPDLCPPGGAALLLECPGSTPPDRDPLLRLLYELGVLRAPRADVYATVHVPYAYVLFRRGYRQALARVRAFLEASGVESVGRYGEWMYSSIEGTLRSGLLAGRRLAGGSTPVLARFGIHA